MAASRSQLVAIACREDAAAASPVRKAESRTRPTVRVNGAAQRLARLVRTIEAEIIPRLVLAHCAVPDAAAERAGRTQSPTSAEVVEFAGLLLGPDAAAPLAYVEAMRARGTAIETLHLELLAPAARQLGERWTSDTLGFSEVTIGLCRLQQVLRELGTAFRQELERAQDGRRALLVPVPGEQHSFGLLMVAEFFRRAGWDVWGEAPLSRAELVQAVRDSWFALVGLSASCDGRVETLASTIRAVRRASRNRAIGVLVGGPLFARQPELVALVGADATATDARQAVHQARNLLALLARS